VSYSLTFVASFVKIGEMFQMFEKGHPDRQACNLTSRMFSSVEWKWCNKELEKSGFTEEKTSAYFTGRLKGNRDGWPERVWFCNRWGRVRLRASRRY